MQLPREAHPRYMLSGKAPANEFQRAKGVVPRDVQGTCGDYISRQPVQGLTRLSSPVPVTLQSPGAVDLLTPCSVYSLFQQLARKHARGGVYGCIRPGNILMMPRRHGHADAVFMMEYGSPTTEDGEAAAAEAVYLPTVPVGAGVRGEAEEEGEGAEESKGGEQDDVRATPAQLRDVADLGRSLRKIFGPFLASSDTGGQASAHRPFFDSARIKAEFSGLLDDMTKQPPIDAATALWKYDAMHSALCVREFTDTCTTEDGLRFRVAGRMEDAPLPGIKDPRHSVDGDSDEDAVDKGANRPCNRVRRMEPIRLSVLLSRSTSWYHIATHETLEGFLRAIAWPFDIPEASRDNVSGSLIVDPLGVAVVSRGTECTFNTADNVGLVGRTLSSLKADWPEAGPAMAVVSNAFRAAYYPGLIWSLLFTFAICVDAATGAVRPLPEQAYEAIRAMCNNQTRAFDESVTPANRQVPFATFMLRRFYEGIMALQPRAAAPVDLAPTVPAVAEGAEGEAPTEGNDDAVH